MSEKNILQEMTAIMRDADVAFETAGGSTRHYLRDVLFPLMEKNGLKIVSGESPAEQLVLPTFWDVAKAFKWAAEYGNERGEFLSLYEGQWRIIEGDQDESETEDLAPGNVAELYCLQQGFEKDEQPVADNARYELRLALRDMIKLARRTHGDNAIPDAHQKRIDAAEAMLKKHSKPTDVLRTAATEQPVREVEAEAFAKYLDEQRSGHTANMWAEKAIWDKPNAFQEWLKYFKQQKEK